MTSARAAGINDIFRVDVMSVSKRRSSEAVARAGVGEA